MSNEMISTPIVVGTLGAIGALIGNPVWAFLLVGAIAGAILALGEWLQIKRKQ